VSDAEEERSVSDAKEEERTVSDAPKSNGRRPKLYSILASAALAAVILGAWTQTWFTTELVTGQSLEVTGDIAAPALTALALCVFVLLGALALAGPFFRVVLSVLEALIGLAVAYSAILAVASPATASVAAVTAATGVAGIESASELVESSAASAWPFVTIIAGILLIVVAIAILVTSRRWPGSSRKYQSVRLQAPAAERTAVDDWDSLSSGDDPTDTTSTDSGSTDPTSTDPGSTDPGNGRS